MTIAAGLEGIRQNLDPGLPKTDNMYLKTRAQLAEAGVSMLPRSLEQALDAFEADPLSRAVMGKKMFDAWLAYKREEWLSFSMSVTDWEKRRYLRQF